MRCVPVSLQAECLRIASCEFVLHLDCAMNSTQPVTRNPQRQFYNYEWRKQSSINLWIRKGAFFFILFLMLSLIFVSQGESAGTLLKGNAVLSGESGISALNLDGKSLVAGKRGMTSPLSWPNVAGVGLFENSQEGAGERMDSTRSEGKDISYFQVVKTLFALVLVIFVILGSLYALKVMMGRGIGRRGGGALIQVLATSFVGPKKAITIVKVAGEHLVLGITNSEISFLSKIEDPEAIQQIELHKVTEKIPFVKVFEKFGIMAKKR